MNNNDNIMCEIAEMSPQVCNSPSAAVKQADKHYMWDQIYSPVPDLSFGSCFHPS